MAAPNRAVVLPFLLLSTVCLLVSSSAAAASDHVLPAQRRFSGAGGWWKVLRRNIGISAMHMALLPNGRVVAFDRTDFGPSNISLPHRRCRRDSHDQALARDCYAHSVEFSPHRRRIRPLTILTDTWCSSGALSPEGVLVQSGGFNDGDRAVRYFQPCPDCDWVEDLRGLAVRRWYATSHVLPDGRIAVIGGREQFNYEFIPKRPETGSGVFELPFLQETKDAWENNLYPFVHLSPDGHLFIFANNKSVLLDYIRHRVVRSFPTMPGGVARNYPSTGSSVLLPLLSSDSSVAHVEAEVMVCGGAPADAYLKANSSIFLPASNTCGRLKITDVSPEWVMEEMPVRRVMGDMVLLPTGDVLIINGAGRGSAGWDSGRDPVTTPVLYRTGTTSGGGGGTRFQVLSPSMIPRMYHSTAHLLPDGRVLVGGSNPHVRYEFTSVLFPTELSMEAFTPPYGCGYRLDCAEVRRPRPRIKSVRPGPANVTYGGKLTIGFRVKKRELGPEGVGAVHVTMVAPTFTTHSFSMSQRVLVLELEGAAHRCPHGGYDVEAFAPASPALAPPGYYMLFVVRAGVPSRGRWVHIE